MRNLCKLALLYIIFSLLLLQLQAQIKIITPESLIEKFKDDNSDFNNTIEVSIANFGSVPYGKTLIGPVFLSDPITACDQINFNNNSLTDKKVKRDAAPIVLAERGECTFVEKAHYAQLAGAKLLVIVDNHAEKISNIIMVEDGYGDIIKIPVVLVSKYDGDKIISEIKDGQHVEIKISFAAAEKNSTVDVQFWLNIENRDSYRLIRNFQKTAEDLGNRINFQPHYQVYQESLTYLQQNDDNCIFNKKYCMNKPEGNSKNTGQDVLKEIVRQLCVYEINPQLWWKYMDKYDQQCVKATIGDYCGEGILKKIEIDVKKTKSCMKKSINTTATINEDEINQALINNDNYKLSNERQKSSSIYFWPTVVIGSQTYKGNLDADDILEDICNSMKDPISNCKQFLQGTNVSPQGQQTSTGKVILIVIVILVVFFFFMIFIYKRMAKRELSREMSSQVNQMVSQYIAFYESKGKNENL